MENDMASNIGGNLVSFVIVGLLGLLGFIIKKNVGTAIQL